MPEVITLAAATAIAKIVLDKFYEGAGKKLEETATKLGEAAVAKVTEKVQQLGTLVWQRCFRGKPGVDQRLESAAKGSEADIVVLQDYLETELARGADQGDPFLEQVKQLAGEIHQVIMTTNNDVTARNVQQNYGGQNLQVNDPNQPVIQVQGNPVFNFGATPNQPG